MPLREWVVLCKCSGGEGERDGEGEENRGRECDPHSCTAVRVPAYVRFGSGTIRAIRFMTCLSLCLSVS